MLFDSSTGDMLAVIECNWITAMRTGAVAALAIETLKNRNARIFSFIGLGVIGNATLDCLLSILPPEHYEFRLFKYKDHTSKVIKRFATRYPYINFTVIDTMEHLVENADVIVSCITDAPGLLVDDLSLFKPGVLVVPVHTRGFQNCDTVFEKVVADDRGHVEGFKFFKEFRKFVELSDVLTNMSIGRTDDNERILAYNIGLGLHDVLFATKIVEKINVKSNSPDGGGYLAL